MNTHKFAPKIPELPILINVVRSRERDAKNHKKQVRNS